MPFRAPKRLNFSSQLSAFRLLGACGKCMCRALGSATPAGGVRPPAMTPLLLNLKTDADSERYL